MLGPTLLLHITAYLTNHQQFFTFNFRFKFLRTISCPLKRFDAFFDFPVLTDTEEQEQCIPSLKLKDVKMDEQPHPRIERGSNDWQLIEQDHPWDTALYEFIEVLYKDQAKFFEVEGDTDTLALQIKRPKIENRKLNVLTLGGSVSWGADRFGKVVAETDSYSSILSQHIDADVLNLAVRGTGSFFPAMCIQSMIRDALPLEEQDRIFDLILIEFSINGIQMIDTLLHRLRDRYPDALIVYIDVWPWCAREHYAHHPGVIFNTDKTLREAIKSVGGYAFNLPRPEPTNVDNSMIARWFSGDTVHLSRTGHFFLASRIVDLVYEHWDQLLENPKLGTWGAGDFCKDVYSSGVEIESEGEVDLVEYSPDKFAYEVPKDRTLEFTFNLTLPDGHAETPIELTYMTTYDGNYPSAKVDIQSMHNATATTTLVQHTLRKDNNHHIRISSIVGYVGDGGATISVTVEDDALWPFRVTGFIICPVCEKYGR